eukprot:m51a1_g2604 hypothetical protein (664) ;mRNA; f:464815-469842
MARRVFFRNAQLFIAFLAAAGCFSCGLVALLPSTVWYRYIGDDMCKTLQVESAETWPQVLEDTSDNTSSLQNLYQITMTSAYAGVVTSFLLCSVCLGIWAYSPNPMEKSHAKTVRFVAVLLAATPVSTFLSESLPRVKECGHLCGTVWTAMCCACCDVSRRHGSGVGAAATASRRELYCSVCRERSAAADRMSLPQIGLSSWPVASTPMDLALSIGPPPATCSVSTAGKYFCQHGLVYSYCRTCWDKAPRAPQRVAPPQRMWFCPHSPFPTICRVCGINEDGSAAQREDENAETIRRLVAMGFSVAEVTRSSELEGSDRAAAAAAPRRPASSALDESKPRLKECGHVCGLTWTAACCSCGDARPHAAQYAATYRDGVGPTTTSVRHEFYCNVCKERCGATPTPPGPASPQQPQTGVPSPAPAPAKGKGRGSARAPSAAPAGAQGVDRSRYFCRHGVVYSYCGMCSGTAPRAAERVVPPESMWFCPHSPFPTSCRICGINADGSYAESEDENAETIRKLVAMGFTVAQVMRAVREVARATGKDMVSVEAALGVLTAGQREEQHAPSAPAAPAVPPSPPAPVAVAPVPASAPPVTDGPKEPGDGAERQHEMCIICFARDVNAVLIPCGHLGMCHQCAQEIAKSAMPLCPVCRARIVSVVQTFRVA